MSTQSVYDLVKLNGGIFQNCDFMHTPAPSAGRIENCTFTVNAGESLLLSGNCSNVTVICNGGTISVAPGAVLNGVNLEGQRCTLELGDHAQVSGLNAAGTCFLTFKCDDNVVIRCANFKDAIFCCTDLTGSVAFIDCNFCGAHLNPDCTGASFIGCKINEHTRADTANLSNCFIRDLCFVHADGSTQYVTNLKNCGLADHPCELSPRAVMHNAGLSGGVDVQACEAPNVPNCRDSGRQIT